MTQNRKLLIIIFVAGLNILFGLWLKGFIGGIVIGYTGAILSLYIVGKTAANRSIRRIDKRMRDYMESTQGE